MKLKFDYLKKCTLLLVSLLAMSSFAFAQRTVTGMVKDADGKESLIGASVLAEGTTTGTVTDYDGKFSLNVPAGAKALIFSYTGYNTQRVELGASNNVEVSLKGGTILDDVVVVGYGTLKSKEISSAVTSVKAEDFNKGNINDPVQLLQGKVAGLSISRPGGDPNGGFNIRMRGLSTIGANTEPLVVVDGVPGASLSSIAPNDIATIDVLKDGSASAIYGTRGSSGVILITTKKGVSGKTSIEYDGFLSSESIDRTIPITTAAEFRSLKGVDRGATTDWFKEITRTALTQNHNLALAGGIKNTAYRLSFNYIDAQGVTLNDGYKRLLGRLSVSQKALNDKLTIGADLSVSNKAATYGFSEAFRYATIYNPTAPVRDDTSAIGKKYGGYSQSEGFDYYNPKAIIEQNSSVGNIINILANIRADYELAKGLKVGVAYAQTREKGLYSEYYSKFSYFRGIDQNGYARQKQEDSNSELFSATGTYDGNIADKLRMNLLGGYEFQEFTYNGFALEGGNILTNVFAENNIGAALGFKKGLGLVSSYKNTNRLIAFFGRAVFSYDDTYNLTASLRREGSSRFGANNKWGVFPAVSASVALNKLFSIKAIDNLKLRVGYGVTGAIPGSSYLSLQRFGPTGNFYYKGDFIPSYGPVSNPNPGLKWETKAETNFGLDFAFLNYRLTGTLDYYTRSTKDLIYYFPVPVPPNLFSNTWANVGELRNTGLELSLNYNVIKKKDASWTIGVNFTKNISTKLVSLSTSALKFGDGASGTQFADLGNVGAPGLNGINMIRVQEGQPIGQIYGFTSDGKYDTNGKAIYKDIDGFDANGKKTGIPDGKIDDADKSVIGNGLPKYLLGLNNSVNFGNFDASIFLRAVLGHDLVNENRVFYELNNASRNSDNRVKTKYWSPDRKVADFNSYYVEHADFLKIDNVTVGYTFKLPVGSSINRLRLYVSANNLATFTNYTGVDPEVRYGDRGSVDNGGRPSLTQDPLVPGIDRRYYYYRTRSFVVGLNIGL